VSSDKRSSNETIGEMWSWKQLLGGWWRVLVGHSLLLLNYQLLPRSHRNP
jgi:hypothetical protein